MVAKGFWLNDTQRAAIEPLLPKNRPGARRVDDRRVISGIVHVLKVGCRWQDRPAHYGPPTRIYDRFHRRSAHGLWQKLFRALVTDSPDDIHLVDSTIAKIHRSAAGGKRAADMPSWLCWYNHHRPHAALKAKPPASTLNNVLGQ